MIDEKLRKSTGEVFISGDSQRALELSRQLDEQILAYIKSTQLKNRPQENQK